MTSKIWSCRKPHPAYLLHNRFRRREDLVQTPNVTLTGCGPVSKVKDMVLHYRHNSGWYFSLFFAIFMWCSYVACFTLERLFWTTNGLGRVSFGLWKACLQVAKQPFVPEGCYDYFSSFGAALSSDCDPRDVKGESVTFCDKRRAAASLMLISSFLPVVSSVGLVLSILEINPKTSGRIANWPNYGGVFLTFVSMCILASIYTAFDVGSEPGDPDFLYGFSFSFVVMLFFAHAVASMAITHATFTTKHYKSVHTEARSLADIGSAGR